MMKRPATRSRATGFRIAATLLIVLLTAAILAGIVAQWSAASPTGLFSGDAAAVAGGKASALDAKGLAPGQTVSGGFVISNDGAAAGRFTLGTGPLVDKPGADGGSLAQALHLVVTDVTDAAAPRDVYRGPLAGLHGLDLGSFSAGAVKSYRFTVTFPRELAAGSTFAASSVSVAFDWTAATTG
jgi:hypothetical protein